MDVKKYLKLNYNKMNRIRKFGSKWQVLITPTQNYNPQFEILVGGWDDDHLRNFYILEYDNLGDAQCEAFKHPDIDWTRMVLMHKSAFHDIKKLIEDNLKKHKFICDFVPQFMDSSQTKNAIFDRVMTHQDRFKLVYHMNDIISFHIINPWTKNINEIASKLIQDPKLKIIRSINNYGMINLIGKNDLGTTYEIGIWTTLIAQWARWAEMHPNVDKEVKQNNLNNAIKKQKELDAGFSLR